MGLVYCCVLIPELNIFHTNLKTLGDMLSCDALSCMSLTLKALLLHKNNLKNIRLSVV